MVRMRTAWGLRQLAAGGFRIVRSAAFAMAGNTAGRFCGALQGAARKQQAEENCCERCERNAFFHFRMLLS